METEKTKLAREELYKKLAEAEVEQMNGEEFIEAADVFEKLRETHIK